MASDFIIRKAQIADAIPYFHHLKRHFAESGNNDFHFHPSIDWKSWDQNEFVDRLVKKWKTPYTELNWEILWLAEREKTIVGHIDLRGANLESAKHRCVLGMGIEKPARGLGLGSRLMETAIAWAKTQEHLEWIDLYVFSENHPARALYKKFQFREIGTVEDMFRVGDVSIDDIAMVLKLT